MKDSEFQLFLASVRQSGRIRRDEAPVDGQFELRPEVEAIRAELNQHSEARLGASHLDVEGVPLGLTAEEIVETLRETHGRENPSER